MPRPFAIAPRVLLAAAMVAAFVAASALLVPRAARANGAFPESFQLVLPADRPEQLVLATNFGLIISDDDGVTWTWTCEQNATQMGSLYAVSAPPLDRFFSMSTLVGLAYSDDDSCSWTSSGGSLDSVLATDYFPDPTNPMRVYAMGANPNDDTVPAKVFPSDDGGATFGAAIFTAGAGLTLSGLESARSDPRTIYLASFMTTNAPTSVFHPRLQRSSDGGTTWTAIDVESWLGTNEFRIIAVDPADANVLTVRVIEPLGESLAISRDGGVTFQKVATLAGQFTAYVRLASGTILVAGALAIDGVGFRSTDGGNTFTSWTPQTLGDGGVPETLSDGGAPPPPHLRALATRGGKLYAAAKNFSDDWAVGVSTDEGVTFQKLTRYDQVSGIRACVTKTCAGSCEFQAAAQIWPPSTCGDTTTVTPPPAAKKGCGCALGDEASGSRGPDALRVVIALGALGLGRARRRRR